MSSLRDAAFRRPFCGRVMATEPVEVPDILRATSVSSVWHGSLVGRVHRSTTVCRKAVPHNRNIAN